MYRPTMSDEKELERARIARHTAAYFAAGGTVTQLPHGESGAIPKFTPAKNKNAAKRIQQPIGGSDDD